MAPRDSINLPAWFIWVASSALALAIPWATYMQIQLFTLSQSVAVLSTKLEGTEKTHHDADSRNGSELTKLEQKIEKLSEDMKVQLQRMEDKIDRRLGAKTNTTSTSSVYLIQDRVDGHFFRAGDHDARLQRTTGQFGAGLPVSGPGSF